jgi:hypothetical protein
MLSKLETLLLRVRARAAEPRGAKGDSVPVFDVAPADGAAASGSADGVALEGAFVPAVEAAPAALAPAGVSEQAAPETDGFDSRERLVAAQPVAPAPERPAVSESVAAPAGEGWSDRPAADGPSIALPVDASQAASPGDVVDIEVVGEDEGDEDEGHEEAPASSRRPVLAHTEDHLAQMAFGTEEPPPLHTPPPESGQLPASPAEFDPDVTGVRNAAPLAGPAPPRELVAEATRPKIAPSDAVAELIARAQGFMPSSFVALLDESLLL